MFFTNLRKQMRWILIVLVAMFGGSLLYVGGPGFFGSGSPEQEALAQPVAEVNGSVISAAELQTVYRNNLALYRQLFGSLQPGQSDEIMYRSLDSIIRNRLLLEAARSRNVPVAGDAIEAELKRIKDSFPSENAYREQLRAARLTERDLRAMIQDNLMVRQLEEEVRAEVDVPEEEIRRAYEGVRVRHILLQPEGDPTQWSEEAWNATAQRARELREQILAGADFGELAKEHSADRASAEQGGDLGYINQDSPLVEEFKTAALALEPGSVSEPVRTEFGYHLIEVTERRQPGDEGYAEAREEIEERLRRERGEERFQAWLADLRSQARVVIHDARLRAYQHVQEGNLEAALADYRQALEDDPFDPYIHVSLAGVLRELGRSEEAITELETAVDKAANDPELQLILGLAYWEADRAEDAARVIVQASETADWDANLQFTAAQVLRELGYEEEARAAEQRFEELLSAWRPQPSGTGRIQFSDEDWRLDLTEEEETGEGAGEGQQPPKE